MCFPEAADLRGPEGGSGAADARPGPTGVSCVTRGGSPRAGGMLNGVRQPGGSWHRAVGRTHGADLDLKQRDQKLLIHVTSSTSRVRGASWGWGCRAVGHRTVGLLQLLLAQKETTFCDPRRDPDEDEYPG